MIRKTRKELGDLTMDILKDAKVVNDANSKTLMSLIRTRMLTLEEAKTDVSLR